MSSLSEVRTPVPAEPALPRRRDRPRARATPRVRVGRPSARPDRTPRALLPEAPAIFPWLERRFSEGEATAWIGSEPVLGRLLEFLYAGSARAGGQVSLIEGANRIHPYRVAETGRLVGTDPAEVLRRVRLARAFTAYQLVALVDGWAREVRRHRPTLLVAHGLSNLFESEEVPPEERSVLLAHVAGTLRDLAEESGLPMLLTLADAPATFPGLTDRGPRLFDVVRCRPRSGALALESYREVAYLTLVPRASGQRGLEEFGGIAPQEVILGWDAPPPRTGRPWRNG
ncbi:MAG: hypothetical protein L3J95_02475 [Thermoplasmata archaeon]|nr:hypothetical protein [Thermoplasmata archaeon]